MIQRIHIEQGATGRRVSARPGAMAADRLACGHGPMSDRGFGHRFGRAQQLRMRNNQVSDRHEASAKSTPIGARAGRAASGDPGG